MDIIEPLFFRVMEYARDADREVISMVSGNPDWGPPDMLRDALREYADAPAAAFQYPPSDGLRELRGEIAARHGVDRDRVIITNGASEANYLALATALDRKPGKEVLLTDPGYSYYQAKTDLLGGTKRTVQLPPDGQIDPTAVDARASPETAAMIINTPNNPTGAVYDASTIEALIEIAEEYNAVLISDEVYDRFDYGKSFTSVLSVPSEHTVMTNSFSKSLAITGFRIGYAVMPMPLIEDARTRHLLINIASNRPAQAAILETLQQVDPTYYEQSRGRIADRVAAFTEILEDGGIPCHRPDGAFYVRVAPSELPGTLPHTKQLIDEAGVAGMPASAFGSTAGWFRFALTTDRTTEAAHRLAEYLG